MIQILKQDTVHIVHIAAIVVDVTILDAIMSIVIKYNATIFNVIQLIAPQYNTTTILTTPTTNNAVY